jgi:hypothetical protein
MITINDILVSQTYDGLDISYWDNEGSAIVSVKTTSHGTFRFKTNSNKKVQVVKSFIKDYINKAINDDCGVVKFSGEYINIP